MKKLVVSDVDFTVWCCLDYDCTCGGNKPVVQELQEMVASGEWELKLWSAGGAEHAEAAGRALGLPFTSAHCKAEYPMTREAVEEIFGRLPDLTLDDDETEAIEGVEFRHIVGYAGHNYQTASSLWVPMTEKAKNWSKPE